MGSPAHSICKLNKIINFVLSVKLSAKVHFLQEPLKAYIFYRNNLLFVLQKKPRNKHLQATQDYFFTFKMFFSQVNNKGFFIHHPCCKPWQQG